MTLQTSGLDYMLTIYVIGGVKCNENGSPIKNHRSSHIMIDSPIGS
uniref:Uncharacterized protein n=1 Tax=Romanomermis culicivorax TaxID=13658 RepID=A0A915KMF1_ROMCU